MIIPSFPKKITCLVLLLPALLVFNSCNKTAVGSISGATISSVQLHGYGLNPITDDEWANTNIAEFPTSLYQERPDGETIKGALPSSYLLASPAIRDQGQTGACTGFCGTEVDEMLYYYKYANPVSPKLTVADGMATVMENKFVSPTSYFGADGALGPLFLYYVERCVIEGKPITSDPGANMVNVGEALQGLSKNTGAGTALTLNGVTFKGICTEDLYPFPTTPITAASPYNLITKSSPQYQTPPSSAAISDAFNFGIAVQTGSTGTGGATTTNGYYAITSTGDSTEVENCKIAIANNLPVIMGFDIYDNKALTIFNNLTTTSYIYDPLIAKTTTTKGVTTTTYILNPALKLSGGHAVPLIGYVDDGTPSTSATGGGYFIAQNSWGTPWGYHGYFYLPYSVLMNTTVISKRNLYVAIL